MPNMKNQISIVYVLPAKQGKINDSDIRMSLLLHKVDVLRKIGIRKIVYQHKIKTKQRRYGSMRL